MKTKVTPLVSIGLPTYDAEKRIRKALDSLRAQTYPEIEFIISDNASSDKTGSICQHYAARDPRFRFFRQRENIGRIENFLFVFRKAQGEFFLWAGDDDEWDSTFIATLVDGLQRHPDHGVALSSYQRSNPRSGFSDTVSFTGSNCLTDLSYYRVFKKMVMHEPIHVFFSGLWRRNALARLLERPIPATIAWDRIMMAEAALSTHFYSTGDILFHKYLNPISIKSRHGKDKEQHRQVVPFAYLRYVGALFSRIIFSPLIPWYRKLYVPVPWFGNLWRRRKRIIGVMLRDIGRLTTSSEHS